MTCVICFPHICCVGSLAGNVCDVCVGVFVCINFVQVM